MGQPGGVAPGAEPVGGQADVGSLSIYRLDAEDLIRRSAEARAGARAALRRSEGLVGAANRLARASHEAVLASRPRSRYASIEGVVDGMPTRAAVRHDASVVVEAPLRRRLELVEALGETDAAGRRLALRRDPLSAMLLVVRACDEVRSVTFADGRLALELARRAEG